MMRACIFWCGGGIPKMNNSSLARPCGGKANQTAAVCPMTYVPSRLHVLFGLVLFPRCEVCCLSSAREEPCLVAITM